MAYRFIEDNYIEFGVRWLLRHISIHPNADYNYLKHRKVPYYEKRDVMNLFKELKRSIMNTEALRVIVKFRLILPDVVLNSAV